MKQRKSPYCGPPILVGVLSLGILISSISTAVAQTTPTDGAAFLENQLAEKFGKASISSVQFPQGKIRIQTNLVVVNDTIYKTVLIETCRVIMENPDLFHELREVVITNERERQGYIYQAPGKCEQLNGTTVEQSARLISEDTRFCSGRCQ